VQPGIPEVQR